MSSVADWSPTAPIVGAILRTRTVDTNGTETGTFSEQTRPTGVQVASLITQAAGDLALALGTEDLPELLWRSASTVASYRAGMLIELTYFPEQVATGRSPYAQLKALYDEALRDLRTAYSVSGPQVPSEGLNGGNASYAFPTGVAPLDALLGLPPTQAERPPWSGGLYQ